MGGFDDYTLAGDPTVGSTGAVWWAIHNSSGRAVAVTELAGDAVADEAFLVRLRSTAATLARAPHANVLPVREVVEGPAEDGSGRVWVVEDWVEGRELGDVIADGPLTPEQSVSVACGVLRGLAAAHAHGIVHGDVSPRTIVITAAGVAQVAGFGFAGLPGAGPADGRRDVVRVATVLRQLLAGGPSSARKAAVHGRVDKATDQAVSGDGRRPPADAAALLVVLEKAARSDFGKGWEGRTSLAPLAAAPPGTSTPPADPVPAPAGETQELPVDETQALVVVEPADPVATAVPPSPDPDPAAPEPAVPEPAAPEPAAPEPAAPEPAAPEPAVPEPAAPQPAAPEPAVPQSAAPEPAAPEPAAPEPAAPEPAAPEPAAPEPAAPEPAVPEPAAPEPAVPQSAERDPVPTPAGVSGPPPGDATRPEGSTTWGDRAPVPDPAAAPPAGRDGRRYRGDRRPQRRGLVRYLAGVIMILLGAGAAIAVERIQTTDLRSDARRASDDSATLAGPTPTEIESSDVTGAWVMKLVVVESTGFFGTQVGNSVEKTYTITSDCSATPCTYKLEVSGQPGRFGLRQAPEGYVLSESGPNDCIDLPSGAVRVPSGGVASVQAHLRPSGAARTPRGDWAATGLTGSIVTTFDTSHPGCIQGSGLQRSTVVGTRR